MNNNPRFVIDTNYLETAIPIITNRKISICDDPEDNIILELASAGNADFIITGDDDLLRLGSFEKTSIIKASEFFKR